MSIFAPDFTICFSRVTIFYTTNSVTFNLSLRLMVDFLKQGWKI
jgi:hypothetical protein